MSTSEGAEHLDPDATPTPADASAEPLAEGGHEEPLAPADEAAAVEEAVAEEPVEKGPGFFARMVQNTSPYTMLLWIALAALIAGVALLAIELSRYGWDWKAKNVASAASTIPVEAPAGPTAFV